jgi:tetratricopeptide (TPR) repeat protein
MSEAAISGGELVDLAKSSLGLGDAEAALQLLAQIPLADRDNDWTATQVEALRLHGDFEECRELATSSLPHMLDAGDWGNARRTLVECGRAFDEMGQLNHPFIELLHKIEVQVRSLVGVDQLFRVQVSSMLASRVNDEGDTATAIELIAEVAVEATHIQDRRALGSLLWVQSEIAQSLGNVEVAFGFLERAVVLFQEEGDVLAVQRVITRMAGLLVSHVQVDPELLNRALVYLRTEVSKRYATTDSEFGFSMVLFEAHLELSLGNADAAIDIMESVGDEYCSRDELMCWSHIIFAECATQTGDDNRAAWHLDRAIHIANRFVVDGQGSWYLTRLGHICIDLGRVEQAKSMLEKVKSPVQDYSWCLPGYQG